MKKLLLLLLCGYAFNAPAQQLIGLSYSNLSGTNTAYQNPATLAGSPLKFSLNLATVDAHVLNNYVQYDGPYSFFQIIKDNTSVEDEYLIENLDGKPKSLTTGADVRGPAFMLGFKNHGFALSTRARIFAQANNITEDLARLIWLGADDPETQFKTMENQSLSTNTNAVTEIALSYGGVLVEKENYSIKVGASLKRLWGAYSTRINSNNLTYEVVEENMQEPYLDIRNIDMDFTYSSIETENGGNIEEITFKDLLALQNSAGKGWGYDLGFTYEYYPESNKKNKSAHGHAYPYKLRVGVSLTDIGKIKYKGEENTQRYKFNRQDIRINAEDILESDASSLEEVFVETFDLQPSEQTNEFTTYLPTALNLNLDYRLAGKLFFNFAYTTPVRDQKEPGFWQNKMASLTPRLEMKALEFAVPLVYYPQFEQFSVGSYLRLGPLSIGSDNLNGLLGFGDIYGANLYAGLSFRLFKKSY